MGLKALAVATSIAVLAVGPAADAQGVPVIAAPWLDDIAMAAMTAQGPVIFVNLNRCKAVGNDVCSFVREHELGHIRLKHASTPLYTSYVNGRALAEAEADCFAAKNALLVQVKAAIAMFETPPNSTTDPGDHGTGLVRAKRIRACRGL
jgi:hypothetical protein